MGAKGRQRGGGSGGCYLPFRYHVPVLLHFLGNPPAPLCPRRLLLSGLRSLSMRSRHSGDMSSSSSSGQVMRRSRMFSKISSGESAQKGGLPGKGRSDRYQGLILG